MVTTTSITTVCNQKCLYCAADGRDEQTIQKIETDILNETEHLILTGGETTLCKNLPHFIRLARTTPSFLELQSNGVMFSVKKFTQKITNLGIDLFNIALPSHLEEVSDKITQTKRLQDKRIQGIRNLIDEGADVRITNIMNSLNYEFIPEYIAFIEKTFPEIRFLEMNFVKAIGAAEKDPSIVPRYEDVSQYLIRGLKKTTLKIKIDHIPLCHLHPFEHLHVDIEKLLYNKNLDYLHEKQHTKECTSCSLKKICSGPRKDYTDIHGIDIIPQDIEIDTIIKKQS